MKKIIQKQITETFCDGCGDKLEFDESLLVDFEYGYGSDKDGIHGDFYYCHSCADLVWDFIKQQWPKLELKRRL